MMMLSKRRRKLRLVLSWSSAMCYFLACHFFLRHIWRPTDSGCDQVVHMSVVTIGSESFSEACTPGISKGNEWCIKPVDSAKLSKPCKFERWTDLMDHLGGNSSITLKTYERYREQFDAGGRIGLQQDSRKMAAIYIAHLNALRELCSSKKRCSSFGIVLEGDAITNSLFRQFHPRSLSAIMGRQSDVTVFNLGPSTPVHEDGHRLDGFNRGQYFVPHRLGTWGAVAVGYNLSTACSKKFLAMQDALVGCLPSDIGIYSGAGGYSAADSTLSFFPVKYQKSSTNAADDIHAKLSETYAENLELWIKFRV